MAALFQKFQVALAGVRVVAGANTRALVGVQLPE
jgi:hypothetical protein